MQSKFGLVYVATGPKHSAEALANIRYSLPYILGLPTCLITDQIRGTEHQYFTDVRIHESPVFSYRDKISGLSDLPFDVNLFIDSDAFVVSSIDSLFQLSSFADFAAAHAPVRHPPGWSDSDVPLFFPEFNSGVMLFKKSSIITELIQDWLSTYDSLFHDFNQHWDQASLRSVLWRFLINNNLRVSVLPPEANLRTTKPWIAGRGLPVSIVHGRFDYEEVNPFISFLNSDIDRFRTWSEWLNIYPNSTIRPRFDRTFN